MPSKLDKKEVGRAQVGPRELKDPRSKEYAIQTLYALKRYAESKEIDVRRIEEELSEIERYQHWKILGYASKQDMLEAEGLSEKLADIAERTIATMKDAQPVARHGEIGRGRDRGDIVTSTKRGNSAEYLAGLLKRDHPDIAAAAERGEYRSIRAAAIAAGIVKVKTPLDILRQAWAKASETERETFIQEITPHAP
jgi:hypothetical protein